MLAIGQFALPRFGDRRHFLCLAKSRQNVRMRLEFDRWRAFAGDAKPYVLVQRHASGSQAGAEQFLSRAEASVVLKYFARTAVMGG